MHRYMLKECRSRVVSALSKLEKITNKLRTFTNANKLDTDEANACWTSWMMCRSAFENYVLAELPRHVRDRLTDGDDSVTRGLALRFRPESEAAIELLPHYMRSDLEDGNGWLRLTKDYWHSDLPPKVVPLVMLVLAPPQYQLAGVA